MRKITFHEEAESEAHAAALYYEERATDLGLSFLDEIEKSSQRILANPYGLPACWRRGAASTGSSFPIQ